jgi:carbonic anhydrase
VASEVATETSDAKSGDTESLFDMRTQEATVHQRSVDSSSYDCAHITVVTNGYSIQAKVSDREGIRQLLDFVKARI